MKNERRAFLKLTGLTGLTVAGGGIFKGLASAPGNYNRLGLDYLSLLASPRQSFQMNEQIKAAYEVALNILTETYQKAVGTWIEITPGLLGDRHLWIHAEGFSGWCCHYGSNK